MRMLLVYLLQILDCSFAAPTGREVYRLPQSTLQALSERGTVVLEAALASALSALELAVSERSRAERGCKGCPPCLFQDCGQRTGPCGVCGRKMVAVQNVTQPRSRIVGGFPAAPGAWPWLVNLRLEGELMCGGVLVDSTWVLTAAHCFTGSRSENSWTAVVGEFDITKTDAEEQVMKVNRIISHPKFNKKTFNNDIALVELTSPVVLSDRVTPVCLPSGEEPAVGTPCSVAGWGSLYEDGPSADVVMEAKVPILSQNTCKSALGKELVTNTMFCAGYLSGGIDSCQGDSGGPLTCQDPVSGRFQLYGITSWGDGCGVRGKPGVYTRVTAFSDWVRSEIQKSLGSREPTCPELLRTSELSEEQQRSEFSALCRFYVNSCSPLMGTAACTHLAEDKCRTRYKKCQLRSFLQTLLDLLQRADVYIREKAEAPAVHKLEREYRSLIELLHSKPAIESSFTKQMGKLPLQMWINNVELLRDQRYCSDVAALCPGESESAQHVNMVREAYRWILGIPSKNLCMTFQEVLVDIASKNEKGLYEARVRATVGGRPFTFYSLVGLESESFYRSMPRVIALALDALKT
uniref:Serine protease 56 n=1 Tax=Lepisosteus oculatus TaxID=7918 RepID=W5MFD6_LEPOC